MKKITSFTSHVTAEGQRISYTYSEVDESGNLKNQNIRENFIVMDERLQGHIDAINTFINERMVNYFLGNLQLF